MQRSLPTVNFQAQMKLRREYVIKMCDQLTILCIKKKGVISQQEGI